MKKITTNLEQWDLWGYDYVDVKKSLDRYAPQIGSFLIRFSYLEHELNLTIAEILNERTHEIGYAVIEKLTFTSKIDLFYKMSLRLSVLKGKAAKQKLSSIRDQIKSINYLRNKIAHANWQTLDKGFVRVQIFTDHEEGSIKFEKVHITPASIRQSIKELIKLTIELESYRESLLEFDA